MTTPHILYSGLDWLGVDVRFLDESSHKAFLSDIDRIFSAKPNSKVLYLGKEWLVHTSKRNGFRRYLNGNTEGFTVYLDHRNPSELGTAWPLKVELMKPKVSTQLKPALWENPFEAMEEMLHRIEGYYGEVYHRVQRVDLSSHIANWFPTYKIQNCFVTRLSNGEPNILPDNSIPGGEAFKSLSFGRHKKGDGFLDGSNTLYASIYNVSRRVKDRPNSFIPYEHYTSEDDCHETIFNLEFKVWAKVLKGYGIESLSDLREKYRGLWKLLMTKKLSLRIPNERDSNKCRWEVDPTWKILTDGFGGENITLIEKVRREVNRMSSEQKRNRTHTEITGYLADVDWHDLTVDERIERYLAEGGREAFTNEAIEKYRAKKGLKKVLRESSNE